MIEPWESEGKLVEATKEPIIKKRLVEDLRKAGIKKGDTVIFHSSMKSIGWIVGGPVTVISALMEAVSEEGTLVMPTQSGDNEEPANWKRPAVPKSWWQIIREETPPFDPEITPTRGMGRIPETFRKYPNVSRSNHPTASFGAWGKKAQLVVETHPYDDPFGENSPLAKLYQLNAKILLVGIELESITSLHYAEYKADLPNRPEENRAAAILENGKRVWKTWKGQEFSDEDFHKIAADFEEKEGLSPVYIGQAESHIFSMKDLVDYGVDWLRKNRHYEINGSF
ncbi:AAC(3) family N-acetyltransferase [Candidatus Thorarchaeota archaeon]|nr:MAG: AAC(3) family N-acetyltransferase [Candidatus Thorarchaeota archaeon]